MPNNVMSLLGRKVIITIVVTVIATVLTFILRSTGANDVLVFGVSAIALAALASLVGDATDQLGNRMGPGATGVLQSALGNLPELFISIFALQSGLVVVVQTALIGSILANSLLVLGIAFFLGGLKHGVQRFGTTQSRTISTLLLLSVAALTIPSLATAPGAPDQGHAEDLSIICSLVLLLVFAGSIPFSIRGEARKSSKAAQAGVAPEEVELEEDENEGEPRWPLPLTLGMLAASGLGAAIVSDWFVEALQPTMATLGMSEAFAGLVIVAIAGNAVENVVGVQMAIRNKADLAISLILNSSLQVAIALTPALVIISLFFAGPHLTLVLPALFIASVALAAILTQAIVYDGESNWLEGLALMGLYVIIAASVWWGPPITP